MTARTYCSILIITIFGTVSCRNIKTEDPVGWKSSKEYTSLCNRLERGWNTWDAGNVLSQIFLPQNLAITLEIVSGHDTISGPYLGQNEKPGLEITPLGHAYDGSYTDLLIRWKGMKIRIQSVSIGQDISLLASNDSPNDTTKLIIIPEMKWGATGTIGIRGSEIMASASDKSWTFQISGESLEQDANRQAVTVGLKGKAAYTTEKSLNIKDIEKIVAEAELKHDGLRDQFGDKKDVYDAIQSVFAWNTIYDAGNDRVFTPVSRSWCMGQGFVLFEWDTYFGCYQLSLDNKDLAYANLIAITKEITPGGFVPNVTTEKNKSFDRSQPPVGSMVLIEIYKKFGDKWLLDLLFQDLLSWNRWWPQNRDTEGYLCWGSNAIPISPETGKLDRRAINKMLGAKFESGLDDSPMYDNIGYDTIRHQMRLADVGLISLYIMDCNALGEIAKALDKKDIEMELAGRARKYGKALETLWDERTGIYLNKNLETGEMSHRLSPTNFYPLLSKVPDQVKAERMINEHFYNPGEFWGDWIMPSISRDDPAYSNEYWRGRIWGPMNFLVYLGMRNYDLTKARTDLVLKSKQLLLKSFKENRTVHENYNPDTGTGTSDDYYHWGALLGFMSFLENEGK